MKIHAIQTGSVRIKRSQACGRGHGMARRLRVFADPQWTGWLPTYAWMIDHPEGVIVVDAKGMTLRGTGAPNAQVCLKSDPEAFFRFYLERLSAR